MNTPMKAVGAEAPPGWKSLVDPLIEQCEREGVPIFQIKEKFGTLRFYIDGEGSKELQAAINNAERESGKVCQECGQPGRMHAQNGWLRTLCDAHGKEQGFKPIK